MDPDLQKPVILVIWAGFLEVLVEERLVLLVVLEERPDGGTNSSLTRQVNSARKIDIHVGVSKGKRRRM